MCIRDSDEGHALQFAKVVAPTYALLLNVARDQLDRFAEIDTTAKLLATLASQTTRCIVLNRDDPFVARIALSVETDDVRYFGTDPLAADRVPSLHEADVRFEDDFTPPQPTPRDGLLHPHDSRSFSVRFGEQILGDVTLQQRGLAAMINATAAVTMAKAVLGGDFHKGIAAAALLLATLLGAAGFAASALPALRVEADVADGQQRAEAHRQAANVQDGVAVHARLLRQRCSAGAR